MKKLPFFSYVAIITLLAGCAGIAAPPQPLPRALERAPDLVTEEFYVPARDPGIQIYVRNKRPAAMASYSPARTVLFVHGATYPAETSFDLELDGISWMEYIAGRGFDVYLLDVRGYGRSTRPPQMREAAELNPPLARGDVAVRDLGSVVDHVLARRNLSSITLLSWSWGATLQATYAIQNPEKVNRLVLYAPGWLRTTPPPLQASAKLEAYRTVRREQAKERWFAGVPLEKRATLVPTGWFEAWADATFASDPEGAKQDPPVLRAPNGVVQDGREFSWAGRPYYDPSKIVAPTLIIGAEWDADNPPYMRQALFPLLVNSRGKRYVELAEGTHTIMLERNRLDLFEAVQAFLEEDGRR